MMIECFIFILCSMRNNIINCPRNAYYTLTIKEIINVHARMVLVSFYLLQMVIFTDINRFSSKRAEQLVEIFTISSVGLNHETK